MEKAYRHVVEEANDSLFVDGNLDDVGDFFAKDYAVHISGRDLHGGHMIVRDVVGELTHKSKFKGFPASGLLIEWRDMVTSRFNEGRIVEEWVVTDLAEQLLLSRKRDA